MFSAARHSNATTTTVVEVDRNHTLRCQGRFMRTAGIQQSQANRIPRFRLRTMLETLLFSAIYTMQAETEFRRLQKFGRPFRLLGDKSNRERARSVGEQLVGSPRGGAPRSELNQDSADHALR